MATSTHILPHPDSLQPGQAIHIWMPSKHMGNLLVSLRAVEALLDYYSRCPCTLIIDESYRDIMAAANLPAPVIYFPRKKIDASGIAGKLRHGLAFIAATRRSKAVISIAVEGDKVSQRFLPLSGCTFSAGPDNRYCRRYGIRLPLDHGRDHVFFDYEAVARQITGRALTPGYVKLSASQASQDQVNSLLSAGLANPDNPYAILHPCATKDYKQWPVEFFAQLADYLHGKHINVVLTGAGDFDKATIDRLQELSRHPVLSLHNRLSLVQLIALMSSARFFIGNDTGPTHLAASCGIPTFALFGPTNEFLWGPMGDNARILRSAVPCEPGCLRRQCAVGYRCMQTLLPETVISHINGLL